MLNGKQISLNIKLSGDVPFSFSRWLAFLKKLSVFLNAGPIKSKQSGYSNTVVSSFDGGMILAQYFTVESTLKVDIFTRHGIDINALAGLIKDNMNVFSVDTTCTDYVRSVRSDAGKEFGWHVTIDLVGCNENVLHAEAIQKYSADLVKALDMKPYGECQTPYFGVESDTTKGHSLVQLIETSLISGHFSDFYRSAHIDIFSCKPYDAKAALVFTLEHFGGNINRYECFTRYCKGKEE